MSARFCGTGSCVPDYVMDNDGVAELVETSDSWIRERTGIARRHNCSERDDRVHGE